MTDTGTAAYGDALWLAGGVLALIAGLVLAVPLVQGAAAARRARVPGQPVQPRQPVVPDTGRGHAAAVVHYTPELFGGREHSMHIAHVASVLIDRNLFFSDVLIESSGGTSPVRCHGHRKADAVEMKRLIEQYQSEYLSRAR